MKKKGFTLIELLATIVILAVVAVVVTISIQSTIKASKISTTKETVQNIFSTCYTYLFDSGNINGSKSFTISSGRVTDSNNNLVDIANSTSGNGHIYIADDDITWGCIEYPELNGLFYRLYGSTEIVYKDMTSTVTCDAILNQYKPVFTFNGSTTNSANVSVFSNYSNPTVSATSSSASKDILTVKLESIKILYDDGSLSTTTYDNVVTDTVKRKYRLTYSAYDPNYLYTFYATYDVTIIDNELPVLTFVYPNTTSSYLTNGMYVNNTLYVIKNSAFNMSSITVKVTDNSCGTDKVTTSYNNCINVVNKSTALSTISTSSVGQGSIKYSAHDYKLLNGAFVTNNYTEAILNYQVVDITYFNPTFSIPGGVAPSKNVTISYKNVGNGNIVDQYSKDGSNWYTYTGPVNYTNNGTVYARITVDGVVVTTSSAAVTGVDKTPPVITLSYTSKTIAQYDTFTLPTYTVTDNSGASITPTITNPVNMNVLGTYTVTYSATDPSGNTSTATATVYVVAQTFSDWSPTYPTGGKNIQSATQYRYPKQVPSTATWTCAKENSSGSGVFIGCGSQGENPTDKCNQWCSNGYNSAVQISTTSCEASGARFACYGCKTTCSSTTYSCSSTVFETDWSFTTSSHSCAAQTRTVYRYQTN